ncbi:MAG: YIP1 family protein [Thermoanaerobaculia bacterium]|nr:YIP1 family protein [Thermoanaerobaculia bacterium]
MTGVLFSPAKTFDGLAARPTWVVALLVLLLAGVVTSYLAVDRVDFEEAIREQLEARNRPVPDDSGLEGIARVQKIFAWAVGPVVFASAFYFLAALLFWLGMRLAGSEMGYMPAVSTTLHGYMPAVVKALVTIPVILGRAEITVEELQTGSLLASNLSFLAPEEAGPVVTSLLSSVDLFSIWSIVLLGMGFSIVGKISRQSATVTVVVVWLIGVAAKVGFAALGQAFS